MQGHWIYVLQLQGTSKFLMSLQAHKSVRQAGEQRKMVNKENVKNQNGLIFNIMKYFDIPIVKTWKDSYVELHSFFILHDSMIGLLLLLKA